MRLVFLPLCCACGAVERAVFPPTSKAAPCLTRLCGGIEQEEKQVPHVGRTSCNPGNIQSPSAGLFLPFICLTHVTRAKSSFYVSSKEVINYLPIKQNEEMRMYCIGQFFFSMQPFIFHQRPAGHGSIWTSTNTD